MGRYVFVTNDICFVIGAFNLYDLDHDGFITRTEMHNIVEAIYQMVVSTIITNTVGFFDFLSFFHILSSDHHDKSALFQYFCAIFVFVPLFWAEIIVSQI